MWAHPPGNSQPARFPSLLKSRYVIAYSLLICTRLPIPLWAKHLGNSQPARFFLSVIKRPSALLFAKATYKQLCAELVHACVGKLPSSSRRVS